MQWKGYAFCLNVFIQLLWCVCVLEFVYLLLPTKRDLKHKQILVLGCFFFLFPQCFCAHNQAGDTAVKYVRHLTCKQILYKLLLASRSLTYQISRPDLCCSNQSLLCIISVIKNCPGAHTFTNAVLSINSGHWTCMMYNDATKPQKQCLFNQNEN